MKNPINFTIATMLCVIAVVMFISLTVKGYDQRCHEANGTVHTYYNSWTCVDSITGERIAVDE